MDRQPVSPAQLADLRVRLLDGGTGSLDEVEALVLLTELELLTRTLAAVSVRAQVAFRTARVAAEVQSGIAPSRAGRAVPDDLARARRTSPYWGSRELTCARALVTEMPATLHALQEGEITLAQARTITETTTCLDPADRAEVDRRLAPALPGASTAEIAATTRALVYEVDPKGFVERARRAAADRGVSIRPCPDVMALLSARLPAAHAIACHTALKAHATTLRAAGDPRTLAQLMADELFSRLTGRTVVDGVDIEVGLVITDTALFGGSSEAADLPGYGPLPAQTARDLLTHPDGYDPDGPDGPHRPGERLDPDDRRTHHRAHGNDGQDPQGTPPGSCPQGSRCTSWSCTLLHGAPPATPGPTPCGTTTATTTPPPTTPPPTAAPNPDPVTPAARVWLRRLWTDPATGVLIGRDTRRRLFTGSLRAALVARDRTCRNTWCGAPIRTIDHKTRHRDGGPTSDTNGQGLCHRCNNAREHPRATPVGPPDYRPPPPLLPAYLTDTAHHTPAA